MIVALRVLFWRTVAEVYACFAGAKAAIHYRRRAGAIRASQTRALNRSNSRTNATMTPSDSPTPGKGLHDPAFGEAK